MRPNADATRANVGSTNQLRMHGRRAAKTLRNRVRRLLYVGNDVQCPLCANQFKGWVGGRPFGRCPGCMAATRSRVLFLLLKERPALLGTDAPVLHFAPETCLREWLEPMLGRRYISTDLRRTDVTTQQDITNTTFEDHQFGAIVCSHVLEHIPDDGRALAELARILQPGAHLLVQVPLNHTSPTDEDDSVTDPQERLRRWGEPDHLRMYGLDLADRISAAGFDVQTLHCPTLFDASLRARHGLGDEQVVFVARKRAQDAI